jgi:NAD-dependent SIR2 family protein deacetylase
VARARNEAAGSALLLVVGSTLRDEAVSQIVQRGLDAGARLVIVAERPTVFDNVAALLVRGRVGETIPSIAQLAS